MAGAGLIVVVAAGTRTWLTGTTSDAVLGASTVTASGSQAAPGAVPLALVVVAAVVAAMVAGARARRAVAVLAVLAALGSVAVTARTLLDPAAVLGPLAATAAGRSGSLTLAASAGPAAVTGLLGALLLLVVGILTVRSVGRWPRPSGRYDVPADDATSSSGPATEVGSGARGERTRTTWDALSAGQDPTDVPSEPST